MVSLYGSSKVALNVTCQDPTTGVAAAAASLRSAAILALTSTLTRPTKLTTHMIIKNLSLTDC